MARCAHCDDPLTETDRAAMQCINDEYDLWEATPPYDFDDDSERDLLCASCLDHIAEQAAMRADEAFYGGDRPSLGDTMEMARRLK